MSAKQTDEVYKKGDLQNVNPHFYYKFLIFSKTSISVRVFAKGVIEITPARILPPLCKGRWHALRDGGIGYFNILSIHLRALVIVYSSSIISSPPMPFTQL